MKNCLILGSGRSGTSMMGGILHDAGYFLGDELYPGRDSNPKGFFENAFINGINERILKHYDRKKGNFWSIFSRKKSVYAPGYGQRWLMSLDEETDITCTDQAILSDIKKACNEKTFSYKDPRFSYTLPVWESFLPSDTVYVVLFRDPSITVNSIMKECSTVDYLSNLAITRDKAYESWVNIYSHVLKNYKNNPDKYFFANYEKIVSGEIIEKLSEFLDADLTTKFVDKALRRSQQEKDVPDHAKDVYNKLLELSS